MTTTTPQNSTVPVANRAPIAAGKYLTIILDGESYAVPVDEVREIIRLPAVTRVPQLPAYVAGVINLRGRVIAVLDLRAQLGLRAASSDRTCIVVVAARWGAGIRQVGLVVDFVEEVVTFSDTEIAPAPEFGHAVESAYLRGMAKSKGKVTMLLDLRAVMGDDSFDALRGDAVT